MLKGVPIAVRETSCQAKRADVAVVMGSSDAVISSSVIRSFHLSSGSGSAYGGRVVLDPVGKSLDLILISHAS